MGEKKERRKKEERNIFTTKCMKDTKERGRREDFFRQDENRIIQDN